MMVLTDFWRLPDRVGYSFGGLAYNCVRPLGRHNVKKLEKTLHDHDGMSLAAVTDTKRGAVMAFIFTSGMMGAGKVVLSGCPHVVCGIVFPGNGGTMRFV